LKPLENSEKIKIKDLTASPAQQPQKQRRGWGKEAAVANGFRILR
jgi:hypothetical protein